VICSQRGFVTTKGGGTTGQSQIYLWRRKVGKLNDAPEPTNLNEHERAVFEARLLILVADSWIRMSREDCIGGAINPGKC